MPLSVVEVSQPDVLRIGAVSVSYRGTRLGQCTAQVARAYCAPPGSRCLMGPGNLASRGDLNWKSGLRPHVTAPASPPDRQKARRRHDAVPLTSTPASHITDGLPSTPRQASLVLVQYALRTPTMIDGCVVRTA
ncbi:hypothetical protein OH76DRAFT_655923 [Lentinus brumalis]|uniref:Uncharacterized protein n=1 Tax=Lentinus brumalis TaxID=2498619 RepID=A0A371D7I2_9APHY|nr:hypothetical protein OH76DRAFT_655923 [Polyporus brumalis]